MHNELNTEWRTLRSSKQFRNWGLFHAFCAKWTPISPNNVETATKHIHNSWYIFKRFDSIYYNNNNIPLTVSLYTLINNGSPQLILSDGTTVDMFDKNIMSQQQYHEQKKKAEKLAREKAELERKIRLKSNKNANVKNRKRQKEEERLKRRGRDKKRLHGKRLRKKGN